MRFSGPKLAFAAMSLAVALILVSGSSLRAAEEFDPAFSSFGSGLTLGEAMASGSPAPRVGLGSDGGAGDLQAPALAEMTGAAAGQTSQRFQVGPAGLVAQTQRSLADAFADAMWRKKVVESLHRRTQAE